jgi:hypothetical protein
MSSAVSEQRNNRAGLMTVAWLWVGLPFAYGVYELIINVVKIFGSS